VKLHGWPDLDPAVLAELRKLAAIRENPYASLRAQYVSVHNERVLQEGGALDDFIVPPMTTIDRFNSKIQSALWVARSSIAWNNPKKLTARKEIARCARSLANTLQALRPDDRENLLHFLPHHRQAMFDALLQRPANWQTKRKASAVWREGHQARLSGKHNVHSSGSYWKPSMMPAVS
jgi:hypothetical protein